MTRTKPTITVTLNQEVLDAVERKRGLVPRSVYIEQLLRDSLKLPYFTKYDEVSAEEWKRKNRTYK